MWDRVRTSMNVFGGTILVIPRPRVTESMDSVIPKRFLAVPMLQEENNIIKQVEVATNSIKCNGRTVAAATGRGFESRRPDTI